MKPESKSQLHVFWETHINAWKETNLSQAAYCLEHELQIHRFGYWKRKLITSNVPAVSEQAFVQLSPVQPVVSYSMDSTLSLQLPNQLRIEGITADNLYLVKELSELLQ